VAIGIAVGGGSSVGWFPLGPREVYVPSYRASRGYVNNVNVTNTTVNTTVVNNYYNTVVVNKTNVNNVTYVNQRVARRGDGYIYSGHDQIAAGGSERHAGR